MDEEDISIDLILRLNIENYLEWLFRVREPSEFDRDSFPLWRKQSFDMQNNVLLSVYEGSALPFDEIQKREINRVVSTIDKLYYPNLFQLVRGIPVDDLYLMGMLFGCIDYVQQIHSAKEPLSKRVENLSHTPNTELSALTLKDMVRPECYKDLIIHLSKWIDPDSGIWVDHSNGHKSFAVALLKYIRHKGYFVGNGDLKSIDIIAIAKNTFQLSIGIFCRIIFICARYT